MKKADKCFRSSGSTEESSTPGCPEAQGATIMIRNRICAVLLGALVLIALPAVSVAAPTAAKQWSVDKTDQISYETDYALYNCGVQEGERS